MADLGELETFEGTGEELEKALAELLASGGFVDSVSPNLRLIRDYTQRGIMSRPDRRGKEAIYRYRHIVEYVVARTLVADGWPLSKIVQYVRASTHEDLLALLPRAERPAALDVVRGLMAKAKAASKTGDASGTRLKGRARSKPAPPAAAPTREKSEVLDRLARTSLAQARLPDLLSALGSGEAAPESAQYTTLQLAPGLILGIADHRLERLTTEDAEHIGRAVTASLLWTLSRGGGSS